MLNCCKYSAAVEAQAGLVGKARAKEMAEEAMRLLQQATAVLQVSESQWHFSKWPRPHVTYKICVILIVIKVLSTGISGEKS